MVSDDTTPSISMTDVPEATPQAPVTMKAVAIGYDAEQHRAPTVLASGKGAIAEQILHLAYAQGIKVREDKELVDILSMLEVDSPIPVEAFAAVAEILTYVYQANASFKQRMGRQ